MSRRIISPASVIIEKTALNFAATFYEVGRSQGLTSKFKTARHYASANMEKFVPHAIHHLREMLYKDDTPHEMKAIIHEAILERINDPEAVDLAKASEGRALPDIDIAKLIPVQELPSIIKDRRSVKDFGILGVSGGRKHG